MMEDCRSILKSIKAETKRGATYIYELSLNLFDCIFSVTNEENLELIRGYSLEILRAHPSMAPLFNLVNELWLQIEDGKSVKGFIKERRSRLSDDIKKLVKNSVEALKEFRSFATLSYSDAVRLTLIEISKKRPIEVLIAVSPPANEGELLAKKLEDEEIRITLTRDHALVGLLKNVDTIILGADAVFGSSIINKVGSFALALGAQFYEKPLYVLAQETKFLDNSLRSFVRYKEEKKKFGQIEFYEPIFEEVPVELVTRIITGSREYSPDELGRYFEHKRLSGFFKNLKMEELYGHG